MGVLVFRDLPADVGLNPTTDVVDYADAFSCFKSLSDGSLWHAHEMLFGYTLAVIVGFLFTAARMWSGQDTPTGVPLMLLVLLWLVARVLVVTPLGWLAAIANTAFPLIAAVMLAIPLTRAGNRRNYLFVVILIMLSILSLGVHAAQLSVIELPAWVGVQIALDLVFLLLRGLSMLELINASVATHALTAGAIGSLTIGMMTRYRWHSDTLRHQI